MFSDCEKSAKTFKNPFSLIFHNLFLFEFCNIQTLFILVFYQISQDNANHSTIIVIYDLLHGILQFELTFIIHFGNFIPDSVLH